MASLSKLPTEILKHVFVHLDTAPPSQVYFDEFPSFQKCITTGHSLKNVSLVSHRLRTIVLDQLFAHVRAHGEGTEELILFLRRFGLVFKVESIVIEARSSPKQTDIGDDPPWWYRLLDSIPATRVFFQCEPEGYRTLFNLPIRLDDSWAFKVPCQYIELSQSPDLHNHLTPCNPATGLLAARPWTELKVNEGSSLAAYTSYEYFLKEIPSLLASVEYQLGASLQLWQRFAGEDHVSDESLNTLVATAGAFENLRSFSYIAIFPFYNHVDEILKCVSRMKSLRKLFVKLCPQLGSTVLEDAIQATEGHIDLNDPWSEYVPYISYDANSG